MSNAAVTDENTTCLFGSLRRLLHDQRSGIMHSIAGDAAFELELIPDGLVNGKNISLVRAHGPTFQYLSQR
jgi:hypothetical protein